MKKFCIFVSIMLVSLFTGCGKDKGTTGTSTELTTEATTTESDVVVEIDDTTEEVTVVVQEEEKPAVVPGEAHSGSTGSAKPATTEATGSVKPATTEATTEAPQTTKPATTEAPVQPTKPEKPATTEATNPVQPAQPTKPEPEAPKHQHNYSKWVVDQAAYTETIEHPEEGYWQRGVICHGCGQWFATGAEADAHAMTYVETDRYHFAAGYGSAEKRWIKTADAWTETINHDEVGHWECSCGARK